MKKEKPITTIEGLARLMVTTMASKEDLVNLASKDDISRVEGNIRRVENKLDSVIDRTIPEHDRRISRVEKVLDRPKLS